MHPVYIWACVKFHQIKFRNVVWFCASYKVLNWGDFDPRSLTKMRELMAGRRSKLEIHYPLIFIVGFLNESGSFEFWKFIWG